MPDLPESLGGYQILDRIAAGAVAEVFRARHTGLGGFSRTYAIKAVRPELVGDRAMARLFEEEANVGGKLSHANIVQVVDPGREGERVYIVKEFVDGPDLGQVLAACAVRGITAPVPHAVFVLIEALKALEYAHNRQVKQGSRTVNLKLVHGDLSPRNLLLSRQGEVKVTNFGVGHGASRRPDASVDYLSPEQAIGGPPTQSSDLFSAGVVLYELLTGAHPFRRRTAAHTRAAIHKAQPQPPRALNPDVPPALEAVVLRALQADPARRTGSASEMKEALDSFFLDAGFRFTQRDLATFLDLLLGPREAGPAVAAAEGADDPPTGATDHAAPLPAPPPRRPDPREQMLANLDDMARQASRQADSQDATLIRRKPKLDDPSAWGDAPTRLRPMPTDDESGDLDLDLDLPEPDEAAPPPVEPPPPRPTRVDPPAPAPARAAAPAPAAAPPRAPARSPLRLVAWLGAGAVVTLVVLVVGVLLGLGAADLRGAPGGPTRLTITAPADTHVSRDGARLPGAAPHHLPLDRDGEVTLALPEGGAVHISVEGGGVRAVTLDLPSAEDAP